MVMARVFLHAQRLICCYPDLTAVGLVGDAKAEPIAELRTRAGSIDRAPPLTKNLNIQNPRIFDLKLEAAYRFTEREVDFLKVV